MSYSLKNRISGIHYELTDEEMGRIVEALKYHFDAVEDPYAIEMHKKNTELAKRLEQSLC